MNHCLPAFTLALISLCAWPSSCRAGLVPDPWNGEDIGEVEHKGSVDFQDEVFKINGSGAEIWETSDSFYFVSQALKGNGSIIAHFKDGLNFVDPYAKAGLMVRAGRGASAENVFIGVTSQQGATFQARLTEGGSTSAEMMPGNFSSAAGGSGLWLKLEYADGTVSAFTSNDGQSWEMLKEARLNLTDTALVGLAMTSHDAAQQYGFASFDHVKVEQAAGK